MPTIGVDYGIGNVRWLDPMVNLLLFVGLALIGLAGMWIGVGSLENPEFRERRRLRRLRRDLARSLHLPDDIQ